MNKHIFFAFFCIFLFLGACQNNHSTFSQDFSQNCWSANDSLHFSHHIEQPASAGIAIAATYNEDYPFQNIYLRVSLKSPSGKASSYLVLDTLMDKMGKWRGEMGEKHNLTMDTLPLKLTEKGQYEIHIAQYMRKDTLCGIESIRINML